jgi:Glycosyl transferase family 2
MSVCILAIFKNEADGLEEWLQHYLDLGVSHFYLIDNDSTDNFMPIIEKYKKNITL